MRSFRPRWRNATFCAERSAGPEGEIVRIVCLNIRSGGGDRWSRLVDYFDAYDPDVVVMTEWRATTREATEKWSASRAVHWCFANDGATSNGVCIAAKRPLTAVGATPGRATAGTLLKVEFDSWLMLACYFPQGEAKAPYFEVCRQVARECVERPLLIVGDLNTGNQTADKTPGGEKYARNDDFDGLSKHEGLIDLWRRTNGAEERQWTWLTPKNGFRLDHAFGNASFVDRFRPICRYDHTPREVGLSDHSAILIETEAVAAKAGTEPG